MRVLQLSIILIPFCLVATAEDWSTYRFDAGRGAHTPEEISPKLQLQWTFKPRHAPAPAWPSESRMTFDQAFQVVASATTVFWGHSVEGKIYALDAATGAERWAFYTEGPIRFAPALWKDRLFAVSDDGYLYCLAQTDGKLLWKKRLGPGPEMVMGNGQLISKWPARGGPLVLDDIVYAGAGIWPSEGIYLSAWNAQSGEKVWATDGLGGLYINQPHNKAKAKSGISCQGYLAANSDALFIPTGRAVPAALSKADGKLLYYHLAVYQKTGGASLTAFDHMVFNQGILFNSTDGKTSKQASLTLPDSRITVTPDTIILLVKNELIGMDRATPFKQQKRKTVSNIKWRIKAPTEPVSTMIAAGKRLVAGGKGYVRVLEGLPDGKKAQAGSETKDKTTSESFLLKIEGEVKGLAYAHGRLFVSTDLGHIHCFGAATTKARIVLQESKAPQDLLTSADLKAAAEILKSAGFSEGYALDLGCEDGRLVLALASASKSKLKLFAVGNDPEKVSAARKLLDKAGVYGARAMVFERNPADTGFPGYLADLVVSTQALNGGKGLESEMDRCVKPYGGVVCSGKTGAVKAEVKGPLKGTGAWTHQYANAGNTSCSDDSVVRGGLTVRWFDDFGQVMPSRHGRAPAPLYQDGRMFVLGLNDLRAFDAFNGRRLWTLGLEGITEAYDDSHWLGTATTGGVFCLGGRFVYLRSNDSCLQIDQKSGRVVKTFKIPAALGEEPSWGYIAFAEGRLYGSVADKENVNVPQGKRQIKPSKSHYQRLLSESTTLFAWDVSEGRLLWQYQAQHSIRHNAITVGKGMLYLIDRPKASFDSQDIRKGQKVPEQKPGVLLALNAADGKEAWKVTEGVKGTVLCLNLEHDVLLMANQPTRGALPSERASPNLVGFKASTGERLYQTVKGYTTRPVIVNRTVYAEPGAWDLITGKPKPWGFRRSYGCGLLSAGRHMLTFRSATFGYTQLDKKKSTVQSFGGVRPGCWMNAIPAGGMVLIPEGTSKCTCSYQMKATLVLEPRMNAKESAPKPATKK